MKKLGLCLLLLLLQGCTKQNIDPTVENELKNKAETVVEQINQDRFEQIVEEASVTFQLNATADFLKQEWEKIPDVYGKYLGIDKYYIRKLDYLYQVKVIINYENYKAQYTLGYDENLKLIGVFFK